MPPPKREAARSPLPSSGPTQDAGEGTLPARGAPDEGGERARRELTGGSNEVFRAVADYTYDWESWIDATGQLVWVNPAVERMTGFGVSECFRMKDYPLPLVHPEDREAIGALLRAAAAGGSGNDFEFRVVTRQGETRWLAVSWQGLQQGDGVPLGYRTSVRDIHERKLAERRLQEAMRWAEQAAAARQDFLATMSHELRTPLQCIVGYAQLLEGELGDARQRHFAEIVRTEGEALLRIIGGVLEFSSLQAAESPLEERTFQLAEIVESCVRAARPLADAKGLSLVTKIRRRGLPRYVIADDLRIRQVLTNLVGNAIKFTERGRVVVTLEPGHPASDPLGDDTATTATTAERPRRRVRLTVADTGPGITPAVQARLFSPFYQADESTARKHGGTGLGLAISKRLCDLLGGELWVETEPGRGSTFSVELPVQVAEAHDIGRPPAAPLANAEPDLTPPRADRGFAERHPLSLLVVDDSPAVLELTTEFLKLLGYAADTAATAHEAVTAAARRPYDLILMDLHMPDLDGMTAARLIRAQGAERSTRPAIVALTADPFARARALSSEGGMDAFLTKPLAFVDLKALLTRVAQGEALTDPLRPPREGPREARPGPTTTRPRTRRGRPALREAELDARVLDDLRETRSGDGRTLLDRMGARVLEDGAPLLAELESIVAAWIPGERNPTKPPREGTAEASQALRHVAHRLKGNALLVGATELARQCQKLEDLAATGRIGRRQVRAVVEEHRALERTLRRILGAP